MDVDIHTDDGLVAGDAENRAATRRACGWSGRGARSRCPTLGGRRSRDRGGCSRSPGDNPLRVGNVLAASPSLMLVMIPPHIKNAADYLGGKVEAAYEDRG